MPNYSKTSIDWIQKLPKNVPPPGDAATRYGKIEGLRGDYLNAAYRNSKLTLPALIREDKSNDVSRFPWQGTAAEGVSHLSSKFNISLFPTGGISFFTLRPDKIALDNIVAYLKSNGVDGDTWRNEFEASAAAMESKLMFIFDKLSVRSKMHKAFEHLIVAGNVLLYIGEDECFLYPMDKYVLRRTTGGKPLEILIKEMVQPEVLPEKFLKEHYFDNQTNYKENYDRQVEVYTRVHYDYDSKFCFWWQEAFNQLIPDSLSSSKIDGSPWVPMRFDQNDNFPYGEGLVSRLFGTVARLDGMTQSSAIGYAASLRHISLISPASGITPQMLKEAKQMSAFVGNPEDITVVQGGKTQDLTAAAAYEEGLTREIQQRFAMPLSIQRKGERVTAAEIEYMAAQLESVSAGFYSLFADEVQVPIVTRLLHIGKEQGLPAIDSIQELQDDQGEPLVKIRPITGLAALGRNDDLQRLMKLVQILQSFLPPEAIPKYANVSELVQRITTALGVNTNGLIYSAEEIQQREQAEAQAAQEQQAQAAAMQQEQSDLQAGQAVMNSSVLTELVKTGQITAQDLDAMTQSAPGDLSNTAAQTRPGNF